MDNKPVHITNTEKPISRRDFVGLIIKGGLLATLSGMILPALAYLWPVTRRGPVSGLAEIADLDEIPIGGAKKFTLNGSVILLVRTAQEEVKAFSAICTHLGCLVDWDEAKRQIICPCHAGLFDITGKVVAGPPPRPLPTHEVSISNGKVLVKV